MFKQEREAGDQILTVENLAEMIAGVRWKRAKIRSATWRRAPLREMAFNTESWDSRTWMIRRRVSSLSVMFQAQLRTDAISMADANAWNTASRFGRMYVVEGDVFIEVDYSLEAGVPMETLVAWLGRFIETVEEANVTAPGMSAGGVRLAS